MGSERFDLTLPRTYPKTRRKVGFLRCITQCARVTLSVHDTSEVHVSNKDKPLVILFEVGSGEFRLVVGSDTIEVLATCTDMLGETSSYWIACSGCPVRLSRVLALAVLELADAAPEEAPNLVYENTGYRGISLGNIKPDAQA